MDFYWVPILLRLARLQDPPDDQPSEKVIGLFPILQKFPVIGTRWDSELLRSQSFAYSLTFAWIAPFSGFQSTGIPIFAWSALLGFRLTGCTLFYIPNFCPNLFILFFLVRRDALFLPGLFFLSSSGSILCEVFFNCVWVHKGSEVFTIHSCKH